MLVAAPAVKQFDLSRWKVVIGGARLTKGLAMATRELGVRRSNWTGRSRLGSLSPLSICA